MEVLEGSEAIRVVTRLKPLSADLPAKKKKAKKSGEGGGADGGGAAADAATPSPSASSDAPAAGGITSTCMMLADGQTVELKDDDCRKTFGFDAVLGGMCDQQDVYTEVADPLLRRFWDGFNACILAYGQTASGKTHTMFGQHGDPGLVPRILDTVLSEVELKPNVAVHASAVQVYNEAVYDLLAPLNEKGEPPKRELWWVGHRYQVRAPAMRRLNRALVQPLLRDIESRRALGQTKMNLNSSRSHVVIMVELTQRIEERGSDMVSTLYFVDLAGCEVLSRTQAAGMRATEAISINKSLSTLKRVIETLCEFTKKKRSSPLPVVPYRESVLTKLLQDCMGGSAATTLVCNASQHPLNAGETRRTLEFGQTSRMIVNNTKQHFRPSFEQLEKLVDCATSARDALQVEAKVLLARLPQELRADFTRHFQAAGIDTEEDQGTPDQVAPVGCVGPHSVPVEMCCPIASLYINPQDSAYTTRVMRDPVVAPDGRSYEREALERYWRQHKTLPPLGDDDPVLPQLPGTLLPIFPNTVLASRIACFSERRRWPSDVLQRVFGYLDYATVRLSSQVCSGWRMASTSQHLWFALLVRDFPQHNDRWHRQRSGRRVDWRQTYTDTTIHLHAHSNGFGLPDVATQPQNNPPATPKPSKAQKKPLGPLDTMAVTSGLTLVTSRKR